MKKLILIISMAFAFTLASAQENTDKTLYIIDGAVSTKTAVDQLTPDVISNMNVIKGVESVVVITTKATPNTPKISIRMTDQQSGDVAKNKAPNQSVATLNYSTVSPLCIVKAQNGELSKGDMQSVSPDTIKSILVFKDEQAEPYKKYGDISNGVVLIELK